MDFYYNILIQHNGMDHIKLIYIAWSISLTCKTLVKLRITYKAKFKLETKNVGMWTSLKFTTQHYWVWAIDSNTKGKVKAICGSYSTDALPEWVPSFISRGAAHTKRRERPLLVKEGTIHGI